MARRSLGYTPSVVVVENICRKVGSPKTRQYQNEKNVCIFKQTQVHMLNKFNTNLGRQTDRQTDTMRGS